jgi:hypothetical protein
MATAVIKDVKAPLQGLRCDVSDDGPRERRTRRLGSLFEWAHPTDDGFRTISVVDVYAYFTANQEQATAPA